jgi:hypothetical protein
MAHHEHAVALSGPAIRQPAGPALLAFDETDFVGALEQMLVGAPWPGRGWPASIASRALGAAAPLRLYQAIHRRFNLALLDAHCDVFGQPRLDPRRIESSGLVVRRFIGPADPTAADLAHPQHWQGWMGDEPNVLGWTTFAGASEFNADPAETKAPPARTGAPAVDRLLAARRRAVKAVERVAPMWTVRPEVSSACGRTLLFGLIPTAATVEQPARAVDVRTSFAPLRAPRSAERRAFVDHLSSWLKLDMAKAPPRAGASFDRSWLTQSSIPADEDEFIAFIEQLAYELDAFGRNASRLQPHLAQLALWRLQPHALGAWRYTRMATLPFLEACARIVRPELGGAAASVTMPDLIGPSPFPLPNVEQIPPSDLIDRVTDAALDSLEALTADAPLPRQVFDDETARYAVRAFIRVRPNDPRCPPQFVWSAPSPLFTIAPWFESTGRVPAPIPLPKLDRASLSRLKPNAAFSLPSDLRSLVNPNGAQAMLAGTPRRFSFGIDWVLQLSMPIMTVCGLAAMTVVLTLLNVVFRWMSFAMILVPQFRRR